MPFNLLKKYNELLELTAMNEQQRLTSLKGIFIRDIYNNTELKFRTKFIKPTPKENGEIAMETLFTHLTCEKNEAEGGRNIFDFDRSKRIHWIKFHLDENKKDDMLIFSVNEPQGLRTYIFDKTENYVIVLEPLRNNSAYYLLTAFYVKGKDKNRNKYLKKFDRRTEQLY